VTNWDTGTVGEYTTSGEVVNSALISGLLDPAGIAVSGSNLFVASGSTIGEYTTSGATVNAALFTGLNGPGGIAVSGSNLFVVNEGGRTIGEYTTSGDTVTSALFSTGLIFPTGIAITPTPEPATLTLLGSALLGLGFVYLRRRSAKA
jgi:uncharacterized protein YjiK